MGIKLIASSVALVLLTIMAGAMTIPTQRNRNWNMETIHLILNSQNVDGGFGLLTDQRPVSLYDTYYNLLLLRALRKRTPMRKRDDIRVGESAKTACTPYVKVYPS